MGGCLCWLFLGTIIPPKSDYKGNSSEAINKWNKNKYSENKYSGIVVTVKHKTSVLLFCWGLLRYKDL